MSINFKFHKGNIIDFNHVNQLRPDIRSVPTATIIRLLKVWPVMQPEFFRNLFWEVLQELF